MAGERVTPDRVEAARESARQAQARLSGLAADVAGTEERVGQVHDDLATTRPHEAEHHALRAEHARAFAEHEREYAASHAVEPPEES